MRVLLPIADNESGKEKIAHGFHNAKFVCIYNSESQVYEWIEASSISTKPGDFIEQIKHLGINIIISSYLPPMVLQIFTRNGFDVLKARGNSVADNIVYFSRNQLESFTSDAARKMWGCDSGCSSCHSKSCA